MELASLLRSLLACYGACKLRSRRPEYKGFAYENIFGGKCKGFGYENILEANTKDLPMRIFLEANAKEYKQNTNKNPNKQIQTKYNI